MHGKRTNGLTLSSALIALSTLVCVGFICIVMLIPGSNRTEIVDLVPSSTHLSHKIREWIPQVDFPDSNLPSWEPFWTPIDIEVSDDPMVILCKLNFKKYWEQPHAYPMFRDLENMSGCVAANRRRERMSVLLREIESSDGNPRLKSLEPTGFVFHESRVGSTLVANFLACDPWSLVLSESTPIANAVLHCSDCSEARQIQLLQDVIKLMGRSSFHQRLFIKFQSITVTKINIILKAFPNTPWSFLFRQPVQTMMSHLDPQKGNTGAPCLRSKRNPPEQVKLALKLVSNEGRPNNEAWCAAHLNMLCLHAIEAYTSFNSTANGEHRGLLLDYESLPGSVPQLLLPLFKTKVTNEWLRRMKAESKSYSKGRGKSRVFQSDSKDKDQRATENIQKYADSILMKSYRELTSLSVQSIQGANKNIKIGITNNIADWSELHDFPTEIEPETMSESVKFSIIEHSHALQPVPFSPTLPFANVHSSRPFSTPYCPEFPEKGYPMTFSMLNILNNWNADSTDIPPVHYDSLCHFDYQNASQRAFAMNYRAKEVPFVMFNIPEVDEAVKRWSNVDYLSTMLGKKKYRTETSESNHFMYWRGGSRTFLRSSAGAKWKPPTEVIQSSFDDWLELAVKGQNRSLDERRHQYFRVSSDAGNQFLFDELPFFKPKKSMFMVEPNEQRGIHCRFGMRSVIAEAHFDGSRNAVVMMGGMRRWILTHPDQCENMHMLGYSHPSGRHSEVDWSKPDVNKFPNFVKVMGNEVILTPGDYLFVPTYWIHYIVSLNVNVQCNTRSGVYRGYDKFIKSCGF